MKFAISSLFVLVLLTPSLTNGDHPNHFSLTEVEWNPESERYEVALSVWPLDLEAAVSRMRDRPTNLATVQNLDRILADYIEQSFVVSNNNNARHAIHWVGSEIGDQESWLYFEITGSPTPAHDSRITIENRVFCELNENQINLIQIKPSSNQKIRVVQPRQMTATGFHPEEDTLQAPKTHRRQTE